MSALPGEMAARRRMGSVTDFRGSVRRPDSTLIVMEEMPRVRGGEPARSPGDN
jgi:hypothetical protein